MKRKRGIMKNFACILAAAAMSAALLCAESIPKTAVEVQPHLYRFTDAKGKAWLYREGPFGLSKWEDRPVAASPAPVHEANPVRVTDLGTKVRFERDTPFGTSRWVRNKADLTDEEKALLKPAGEAAPANAPGNVK